MFVYGGLRHFSSYSSEQPDRFDACTYTVRAAKDVDSESSIEVVVVKHSNV